MGTEKIHFRHVSDMERVWFGKMHDKRRTYLEV